MVVMQLWCEVLNQSRTLKAESEQHQNDNSTLGFLAKETAHLNICFMQHIKKRSKTRVLVASPERMQCLVTV